MSYAHNFSKWAPLATSTVGVVTLGPNSFVIPDWGHGKWGWKEKRWEKGIKEVWEVDGSRGLSSEAKKVQHIENPSYKGSPQKFVCEWACVTWYNPAMWEHMSLDVIGSKLHKTNIGNFLIIQWAKTLCSQCRGPGFDLLRVLNPTCSK